MNTIDPTRSLGELVDDFPRLAREFERRGLDYCCGGGRSLAQVCAVAGLDPSVTAAELATVAGERAPAEWSGLGAAELWEHLEVTHHRYLWDELPRLSALVAKIESVHGDRHPELAEVAATYEELRADLEPHMLKEEHVLFPIVQELSRAATLRKLQHGALRNPISAMVQDHDRVGELLAGLHRLTDGYQPPTDGCATYSACYSALAEMAADTHLHIHKENNVLFPMILCMETELSR